MSAFFCDHDHYHRRHHYHRRRRHHHYCLTHELEAVVPVAKSLSSLWIPLMTNWNPLMTKLDSCDNKIEEKRVQAQKKSHHKIHYILVFCNFYSKLTSSWSCPALLGGIGDEAFRRM